MQHFPVLEGGRFDVVWHVIVHKDSLRADFRLFIRRPSRTFRPARPQAVAVKHFETISCNIVMFHPRRVGEECDVDGLEVDCS